MNSLADRLWLVRHAPDRRSTARAVIIGAVLAWVVAAPVLAHADLVTADPADGAVLTVAPTTITLTFSEVLDAAKSSVALISAYGTVATGKVSGDGTVVTLGPLVQDGRPLGPGGYEIRWTSVAADGDVLRGRLTFTVSGPTPMPATPSPIPTPTAAGAPSTPASVAPTSFETAAPEPAPAAAWTGPAASTGDIVLPIVVALASVAAIGGLVLRRSRKA
ncbi:MAG: copper resistance protein CopC [Chloroflexota bacterium]|nr:copper resistance protein CopC [Chloroflexota bacterium]